MVITVSYVFGLSGDVTDVQLEYQLDQERRQRGELEKSRRKLEGDSRSTQESLGEMEKMRSGLEDLIKRLVKGSFASNATNKDYWSKCQIVFLPLFF